MRQLMLAIYCDAKASWFNSKTTDIHLNWQMAALFIGKNRFFVVVCPYHKYCLNECALLWAVGTDPPPPGLCSGAAAGGRETGQGLYCLEINHITRKQKHGWFFDCWMTSLTVTDTVEAVVLILFHFTMVICCILFLYRKLIVTGRCSAYTHLFILDMHDAIFTKPEKHLQKNSTKTYRLDMN